MTAMDLSQNESHGTGFKTQESLTIDGGPMGLVEIKEIPLNKIKLARNSRMTVSDEEISGLMQSIKQVGLLQPIGVAKNGSGYEICYGNRRFLAMSKLGKTKIPAVVHSNKKEVENDLQNLTENLQRRNITLTEAGRYIEILRGSGLSLAEIAVRLGITKGYVQSCINAFQDVPKQFRDDLELKTAANDRRRTPGKISMNAARAIISATKQYGLEKDQSDYLFKAAKSDDSFSADLVPKYAAAMKSGKKNPLKEVSKSKHIAASFWISEDEHERLYKKHVVDGPFKSVNRLFVAILKGEKSERVKIL